jgi:hypothetical protein
MMKGRTERWIVMALLLQKAIGDGILNPASPRPVTVSVKRGLSASPDHCSAVPAVCSCDLSLRRSAYGAGPEHAPAWSTMSR